MAPLNLERHFSADTVQVLLAGGGPFDDGTYLVVRCDDIAPGAPVWASIERQDGTQEELHLGLIIGIADGLVHTFWCLPPV